MDPLSVSLQVDDVFLVKSVDIVFTGGRVYDRGASGGWLVLALCLGQVVDGVKVKEGRGGE